MDFEQDWSAALSELLSDKEQQVRIVTSLLSDVIAGEVMLGQDGWHFPRDLLAAGDRRLPDFRSPHLEELYGILVQLGEARLDNRAGSKLVEEHYAVLFSAMLECAEVGFKIGHRLGRSSKSANPARRSAIGRILAILGSFGQGSPDHERVRYSAALVAELKAEPELAATRWQTEGRLQSLAVIQVVAMSARVGWYVPQFARDLDAYQREVSRCAFVAGCALARGGWPPSILTGAHAQRFNDACYWMSATESDETWSKAAHGDLASLMLYVSGLPQRRELNAGVRI